MKHASTRIAAALLIGWTMIGCEPDPEVKPKPHAVAAPVKRTRGQDAASLVKAATDFDTDVAKLPGGSAEEHRQILTSLLDELAQIIQLGNGSGESPELHNQLAVIGGARKAIDDSSVDRRRMEAAENEALQAAGPALAGIVTRYWSEDDQLPPLLQAQTDKITAANGSIGPMHDLDAANAFTAMKAVVDRITANMQDYYLPR